jgi:hypothetical protein
MAEFTLRISLCDLLDITYPIVLAGMGGAEVLRQIVAEAHAFSGKLASHVQLE